VARSYPALLQHCPRLSQRSIRQLDLLFGSASHHQFSSALWGALFNLLNISHSPTTAYHPQSNGLVERFHRQLKDALRARAAAADWYDHLRWVMLGVRPLSMKTATFYLLRPCLAHSWSSQASSSTVSSRCLRRRTSRTPWQAAHHHLCVTIRHWPLQHCQRSCCWPVLC
jgi:transposase InsO family protein